MTPEGWTKVTLAEKKRGWGKGMEMHSYREGKEFGALKHKGAGSVKEMENDWPER